MIRFTLQILNTPSMFSGFVCSNSKISATLKWVDLMMDVFLDIPLSAPVLERNVWKCLLPLTC